MPSLCPTAHNIISTEKSEGTGETEAALTNRTEKELRESTEKDETPYCHKGIRRHERLSKYKESKKNIAARYAGYSLPDWCPTL